MLVYDGGLILCIRSHRPDAFVLSEEQKKEITKAFGLMDADESGCIDAKELKVASFL